MSAQPHSQMDPIGGKVAPSKPVWNSLEVVKVIISLMTPVMVFLFGLQLQRIDDAKAAREASAKAKAEKTLRDDDLKRADEIRQADIKRREEIRTADLKRADEIKAAENARAQELDRADARRQAEIADDRDYEAREAALKDIARAVTQRQAAFERLDELSYLIGQSAGEERSSLRKQFEASKRKYDDNIDEWEMAVRLGLFPFKRTTDRKKYNRLEYYSIDRLFATFSREERCVYADFLQTGPEGAYKVAPCSSINHSRATRICAFAVLDALSKTALGARAKAEDFEDDLTRACS